MNTISDTIRRISALPDNAEISDADAKILLDAAEAQPFFAAAAVVLLRHWSGSNDSERLADIRHRLALAAADRRTLLTAQHGDAWTKFYPEAADEMPVAAQRGRNSGTAHIQPHPRLRRTPCPSGTRRTPR